MRIWLMVLAVSLLAGCGGSTGQGSADAQRSALAAARALWAERGYNSYEITFTINCFCPPGSSGANVLTVIDNRIVSAVNSNTGMPYPSSSFTGLYTVAQSFAFIESLLDSPPDRLQVEYDPDYGYPTVIDIDYIQGAADDEVSYGFSDLM